jgi:cysteine-rich repeat protein
VEGCHEITAPYKCLIVGVPCVDLCGNGVLDRDWDADYTSVQGDISLYPYLEDWTLTTDQECDDGNIVDGDGCSSLCIVEDGYTCWPVIKSIENIITDTEERVEIYSNCTAESVVTTCSPCSVYFQLTNREELTFTGNLVDKDQVTGYVKIIDLDDASFGVAMTINSNDAAVSKTYITNYLAAEDGSSSSTVTIELDATEARVRNSFGPYFVVNEGQYKVRIYELTRATAASASSFDLYGTYTTTPLQLLGAHEFYWWSDFDMLFTRCRDEDNWYALRMSENYADIYANSGSYDDNLWPETISARQMALFGKLTLPPIFIADYAFFYVTDGSTGSLKVYKYHSDIEYLEYKLTAFTVTETSTDYLDYSMFYMSEADGIIVGVPDSGTPNVVFYRTVYDFDNDSATSYTSTVESGYSTEMGDDLTLLVFLQRRQDPYTRTEERDLYAHFDDTKISKIILDTDSDANGILTVESEITMSAEGYYHTPMNSDIGVYHIVVMGKADCDDYIEEPAPTSSSLIDATSAWFYSFATEAWTCVAFETAGEDTSDEAWQYTP